MVKHCTLRNNNNAFTSQQPQGQLPVGGRRRRRVAKGRGEYAKWQLTVKNMVNRRTWHHRTVNRASKQILDKSLCQQIYLKSVPGWIDAMAKDDRECAIKTNWCVLLSGGSVYFLVFRLAIVPLIYWTLIFACKCRLISINNAFSPPSAHRPRMELNWTDTKVYQSTLSICLWAISITLFITLLTVDLKGNATRQDVEEYANNLFTIGKCWKVVKFPSRDKSRRLINSFAYPICNHTDRQTDTETGMEWSCNVSFHGVRSLHSPHVHVVHSFNS